MPTIYFFEQREVKINVYPCRLLFYYIKVWFEGGGLNLIKGPVTQKIAIVIQKCQQENFN